MICQKLSNMRLGDVMFSQKLRQFFYDRNETKRGISNFSCRKTFFTFWNLDIDLMQSWSFKRRMNIEIKCFQTNGWKI